MKITQFSDPLVLCPTEGVPLGIGHRHRGSKNENDGAIGQRKKFDDIFSRVDRIHQHVRQTDEQTPEDNEDRDYAQRCVGKTRHITMKQYTKPGKS